MSCYDCATLDHLAHPAVGVCHDCGAAVCASHAVVRAHHLTRTTAMLREQAVEPAARILRCTTCDGAYAALHPHTPATSSRTAVPTMGRTS